MCVINRIGRLSAGLMTYLLVSHGTPGAIAAEQVALQQCRQGECLHHLLVIPEWWADMTGDDWLNSGASRNRYREYIEQQLHAEAEQVFARVQNQCESRGINYSSLCVVGNTPKVLEKYVYNESYVKVFVGSRRPSHCEGVNDRGISNKLIKNAAAKLVIIDHPYASCIT